VDEEVSAPSFREAIEAHDIDAARALLADDVVFRSPAVFKPYQGREAVGALLATVAQVFEDFRYTSEVSQGDRTVLVFEARVGDKLVEGADFLRLDADGKIAEFVVMVRPMSGLIALAQQMGARLGAAAPAAASAAPAPASAP
jgi:ketosteroid isomerase-like protein